ncbi:MAG: asparaginase [Alphaproteobacteria bacterium]|nr:asparaginase [Alphaproteobacteria bacterium]
MTTAAESLRRPYLETNSDAPIAVEITRGGMVESVHRVVCAIADAGGEIVRAWGDVDRMVYGRSAIKPLQALQLVETGAADAFKLSQSQLALACASHNGEPMHTDRVKAWLKQIGLDHDDLTCGPQKPYHVDTADAMLRRGEVFTRYHNNCSGKHSGFLTTAVHMKETTKAYNEESHPVQRRNIATIAELGGMDIDDTPRGTDGCGIAVFGTPLQGLARAMAKMADPSGLGETRRDAVLRIRAACAEHPELVGGSSRFNTDAMRAAGAKCLMKSGAEGVYCAALPELGFGIAMKADDGNGRAVNAVMEALLGHYGILDGSQIDTLKDRYDRISNWAGTHVGDIRIAPSFL